LEERGGSGRFCWRRTFGASSCRIHEHYSEKRTRASRCRGLHVFQRSTSRATSKAFHFRVERASRGAVPSQTRERRTRIRLFAGSAHSVLAQRMDGGKATASFRIWFHQNLTTSPGAGA
jgi:hypothetical protein